MRDNKEHKQPQVRAVVDGRQIILGSLALLGMAILMIVGLTPRTADAPDMDAAQAGSDTVQMLAADCTLVQKLSYIPCAHSLTRRQVLPPDLAGKTRLDLEAAYDAWQVTEFSPAEVSMEQSLAMFCPKHMILLPDESGVLCIFQNKYGDALALVEELGVALKELPDAYQEMIRPGKGFDSKDELIQWVESIDS